MSVLQTGDGATRDIFPSQLGARNEELRNEVQDTEAAIGALHAELTESIHEMKSRYISACDHHSHSTQAFASEMALPPGCIQYTQEQLSESAKLNLSTEFIAKYGPVQMPVPVTVTVTVNAPGCSRRPQHCSDFSDSSLNLFCSLA